MLGSIFIVVTNNVANTFFTSQKKLSAKQEFLAYFNFDWLHRQGRHNVVVDTVSSKEVIAYIAALSEVVLYFNERIKWIADSDASYEKLRH